MKSKALKPILLAVTALVLVAATVMATVAYMTSSAAVSNVFTVGNVKLQMWESKVDENGKAISPAQKTDTNSYHLMPGKSYDKDPTIYVDATSEESYLFVRVRNDLKTIECPGYVTNAQDEQVPCPHGTGNCPTILEQLKANGWQEIERADSNVDAVFVYVGDASKVVDRTQSGVVMPEAYLVGGTGAEQEIEVFNNFYLASEIPNLDVFGGARVAIVAYAIQADLGEGAGGSEIGSYEGYMKAWQYVKSELPFVV